MALVDGSRLGRGVRAIRIRSGLRQADVSARAHVGRTVIARIERGDLAHVEVGALVSVANALGADVDVMLRWNGADLDRLLNAGHSAMHELVVKILTAADWEVVPERSFSIWGERGIVDILAWHVSSRTLLVAELKTEIVDVQRLIGTVDRYRRLAPAIVRDLGWEPAAVATWVAVAESPTNRRRLREHVALLRAAFPTDGRTVASWLHRPTGAPRALSFLSNARVADRIAARSSRRRVRVARRPPDPPARATGSDHTASGEGS